MKGYSSLDRGSSLIDWCETNYRFTPIIAEFINTISNLLFICLPPLFMKLFHPYAIRINRGMYIIWILFATVGLCSAYFHATLSLFGQILDELSILWLITTAFGMWLPRRNYPKWLNRDRHQFQALVFVFSLLVTILAVIYPWFNCFALMASAIPVFLILFQELRNCKDVKVRRLGRRTLIIFMVAFSCWVSDRVFCDLWSAIEFPYLHGAWHLLITSASYSLLVLFAFIDTILEHPQLHCNLVYWPSDKYEFGIPFVAILEKKY